jgi:hypothetical protein
MSKSRRMILLQLNKSWGEGPICFSSPFLREVVVDLPSLVPL